MKDKEIRAILKADGLPTAGDSSIMKQRHKRLVFRWEKLAFLAHFTTTT
jgi:hypothetical protein